MAAEAAAGAAINKAIDALAYLITQTWNRVSNLREDIQWVENKMRALRSYLKDAESKKTTNQEAANLILSIRDLSLDVEDILDKYLSEIESRYEKSSFQFVKKVYYAGAANSLAMEIEKIKKRAEEIEDARVKCGVLTTEEEGGNSGGNSSTDAETWKKRGDFLRARESKVFGRREILEKMEAEITSKESAFRVISVVGPGGVGKTTVAKKTYKKVQNEFQCSAVVYVSQSPNVGDLLLDIMKQVGVRKKACNEILIDAANQLGLVVTKNEPKEILHEMANQLCLDQCQEPLLDDEANEDEAEQSEEEASENGRNVRVNPDDFKKRLYDPDQMWLDKEEKKKLKEVLNGVAAAIEVGPDEKKKKVKEIFLDLAKQIDPEEKENLEARLFSFLENRRYVIFLDDVWKTETWDRLKDALPCNSETSSRIMVTSRKNDVCRYIGGERFLIPLDHLNEAEANELFFNLIEDPLPPFLKDIGKKIAAKCYGLPLAIIVAVGLLRQKKKTEHDWNHVLEGMSGDIDTNLKKILALSYQDLPTELKPFFLYFGLFPEDHEVFVSEMMRVWVAEKLIPLNGSIKPEYIVQDRIDKLVDRNLIQVAQTRLNGRTKSCRIHDVLHNFCVAVSKENNFFCTLSDLEEVDMVSVVRRITTSIGSNSSRTYRMPDKLRSLLCFSKDEGLHKFIQKNVSKLKFLRLLIIEVDDFEFSLPKEISKLSVLIYLKLKGQFVAIPPGISKLKNLVTLEISPQSTLHLPASIWKMKHLKHLFLGDGAIVDDISLTDFYGDVTCPIETIDHIMAVNVTPSLVRRLTHLRKLHVDGVSKEIAEVLSQNLLKLEKLEELQLGCSDKLIQNLDLSGHQSIVKLHLRNMIFMVGSIDFPPNMIKITFDRIRFEEYPMEALGRLKQLEVLKIKSSFSLSRLELDLSKKDSFMQLQEIVILESRFSELIADNGEGLPKLTKLIYTPYPRPWLPPFIPQRLREMMVTTGH